jgi:hypothetical protein
MLSRIEKDESYLARLCFWWSSISCMCGTVNRHICRVWEEWKSSWWYWTLAWRSKLSVLYFLNKLQRLLTLFGYDGEHCSAHTCGNRFPLGSRISSPLP